MSEQATYPYDVFISYNHADQEWAENWLSHRLQEAGLSVCTHHTFAPGPPELANIESAITASRHTLLVLTRAWVKSDWESFAGLLARSEDPVGRRRRTIPLLLENCSPPRSIARLVYADFTDSSAWPQQFECLTAVLKGHLHRTAFGPPLGALLGLEAPTNFIFRRNEHFVGREAEFAALHDLLDEASPLGVSSALSDLRSTPKIAGLIGLGGIGKTQLAVEYIHRYRDAYPGGIFWINAAEPLAEGFAKIGMLICGDGHDKSLAELVRITADYMRGDPDTLLVLDNLIEPDWLNVPVENVLVPAALPCRVLFTTRRRDLPGLRTVEVNTLPAEQALRLLLRHPDRQPVLELDPAHPEQQAARRICATLGYLPLALELAAAYLGEAADEVTLDGYLARLSRYGALPTVDAEQETRTAWQKSPTWHDPVAATLASQWDALQDENARRLLQAAALMPEAEAVPAARLGLLAVLDDVAELGFRPLLSQALHSLHGYSMLETLEGGQVRLHPLVREFAEGKIPDRAAFAQVCAGCLAEALWNVAQLDKQVARRGVDAVLEDVRNGLGLCTTEPESVARPRLSSLERILDRQAHTLRYWDAEAQPAFFLQQLRNESFQLDLGELQARAEAELAERRWPYLLRKIKVSGESPELVRTLEGHSAAVHDVALSADGRLAISASDDNTLKVWDVATGRELRTLAGHSKYVSGVALSADGRLAVSASADGTLKVWDVATGRELRTLQGHNSVVTGAALSADGRLAVSASMDQTLKVWDISALLNTGVASGEWEELRVLEGHSDRVSGVALSADGRMAVSASLDRTLKVWDVATGRELHTRTWTYSGLDSVALSADGRLTICGSIDGGLVVWEVATDRVLFGPGEYTSYPVSGMALSADGRLAVFTSRNQTLKVWDVSAALDVGVATGRELCTFPGQGPVALSADGRLAVSASDDQTFRVWDISAALDVGVATGRELCTFPGQDPVALSANGRLAVSASFDRTLKVWDISAALDVGVATGRELRTLAGHSKYVSGAALSADGRLAVSVSGDQTLKVWDVVTGQVVSTLPTSQELRCCAMTPDGKTIVAGDAIGAVHFLELVGVDEIKGPEIAQGQEEVETRSG